MEVSYCLSRKKILGGPIAQRREHRGPFQSAADSRCGVGGTGTALTDKRWPSIASWAHHPSLEFLLKFGIERERWLHWLFEAGS